jgi:hypothetical protein
MSWPVKKAYHNRRNETHGKKRSQTNQALGCPRINIHSGIFGRSSVVVWVKMMECEAKMGGKTTGVLRREREEYGMHKLGLAVHHATKLLPLPFHA